MPINQDEPSFEKLTKRERELVGLRKPLGRTDGLDSIKHQAEQMKQPKRGRRPSQSPAEWE